MNKVETKVEENKGSNWLPNMFMWATNIILTCIAFDIIILVLYGSVRLLKNFLTLIH